MAEIDLPSHTTRITTGGETGKKTFLQTTTLISSFYVFAYIKKITIIAKMPVILHGLATSNEGDAYGL